MGRERSKYRQAAGCSEGGLRRKSVSVVTSGKNQAAVKGLPIVRDGH